MRERSASQDHCSEVHFDHEQQAREKAEHCRFSDFELPKVIASQRQAHEFQEGMHRNARNGKNVFLDQMSEAPEVSEARPKGPLPSEFLKSITQAVNAISAECHHWSRTHSSCRVFLQQCVENTHKLADIQIPFSQDGILLLKFEGGCKFRIEMTNAMARIPF